MALHQRKNEVVSGVEEEATEGVGEVEEEDVEEVGVGGEEVVGDAGNLAPMLIFKIPWALVQPKHCSLQLLVSHPVKNVLTDSPLRPFPTSPLQSSIFKVLTYY